MEHRTGGVLRSVRAGRVLVGMAAWGVAGSLVVAALLPLTIMGGPTRAAGGVDPAPTWQVGDAALAGQLTDRPALPGTLGAVGYEFGEGYSGEVTAEGGQVIAGEAVEGDAARDGVLRVLEGDTLAGSAAAWNAAPDPAASDVGADVGSDAEVGPELRSPTRVPATVVVQGRAGAAGDAALGGALQVSSRPATQTGAAQARWQIVNASADSVNFNGGPSTIEAGTADSLVSGADPAQVQVWVVRPELRVMLEVCVTGTDCDLAAASGDGGWSEDAGLATGVQQVLWRVSATNSGNIDLSDVRTVTASADAVVLEAGIGVELGDLAAGVTQRVTFQTDTQTVAVGGVAVSLGVSGAFHATGPDGQDLAARFVDGAGTRGRVPGSAEATVQPLDARQSNDASAGDGTSAQADDGAADGESEAGSGEASEPSKPLQRPGTRSFDQTLTATFALDTSSATGAPATQPSGNTWKYGVSVGCGALAAATTCQGVTITIPVPTSTPTGTGVVPPSGWTVAVANAAAGLVTSTTLVGSNWVILLRDLNPGESVAFQFTLRQPYGVTLNNTQWALAPVFSASNAPSVTVPATATATSTAGSTCSTLFGYGGTNYLNGQQISIPTNTTLSFSVNWDISPTNQLWGSLKPLSGTYTFQLPVGMGFVSATKNGVYNAANRTVTWSASDLLLLPGQAPDYTVFAAAGITVLTGSNPGTLTGNSAAATTFVGGGTQNCTATLGFALHTASITGEIWSKKAYGYYPNQYGTPTSQGNPAVPPSFGTYAQTLRGAQATWSLTIARKELTLQNIHLFDGMPCLTSGAGTGLTTPYQSLTEAAAPCSNPAFITQYVTINNTGFAGQAVTFEYTDGTSGVITPTNSISQNGTTLTCTGGQPTSGIGILAYYCPAAGKTIASVIVDGSYTWNDAATTREVTIRGLPVDALPHNAQRWLNNTATFAYTDPATGARPVSSLNVGLTVMADSAQAAYAPKNTSHPYTANWSGSQGTHSYATVHGAWSSDATLDPQRRVAIVISENSGIHVTQVLGTIATALSGLSSTTALIPTINFNGQGDDRYLLDAGAAYHLSNQDYEVRFGGMPVGVYSYDVYAGFTGTDLSDTSLCIQLGGTVVTDVTGIIAPVGTARVLCKVTNTITVTQQGTSFTLDKSVRNASLGGSFETSTATVASSVNAAVGQTVEFRLRASNTGSAAITTPIIYDILPYPGDVGVLPQNMGVARGSTQTAVLTGISIPSGWVAEYATITNPCRPEITPNPAPSGYSCTNATWLPLSQSSSAVTLATVKAIRLTGPATLGPSAFADTILSFQAPASWAQNDVAWNIAAGTASAYGSLLAAVAAPKVGMRFPTTSLVWQKTDTAEHRLAGATFRVDGPGGFSQLVTDNQSPDASPTDGLFRLNDLPLDGLSLPATFTITETEPPPGFALNDTPLSVTVTSSNAGTVITGGTVVDQPDVRVFVQKYAINTLDEAGPMDGSQWQILTDNGGSPGSTATGVTVSAVPGVTALFVFEGLVPGNSYWLMETQAPQGFSLLAEPIQFTLGTDNSVVLGAGAGTGANLIAASVVGLVPETGEWPMIIVLDQPGLTLPAAGGPGTASAQTFGLLLAAAGVLSCWWVWQRRQQPAPDLAEGATAI